MYILILFISLSAASLCQESNDIPPSFTFKGNIFLKSDSPPAKISLNNLYTSSSVQNNTAITDPDIKIYSGLGDNIVNSFKGSNVWLHAAAAGSTILLVTSGADYYVHKYFNEHEAYGIAARPVVRVANYFPFVISGSLYAYGKLNKDNEAVGASFAVLQSTVLAFGYNTLLKAITGRPGPHWRDTEDMEDLSKTFRFGFLRGGVFWGWPSGHTSSTMAVVSALANFYPDKTWLQIAGYGYAAYMMFAVSSLNRGGMHWFSDAVAAALMSYAIGSTVGKFYRSKFTNTGSAEPAPVVPAQNIPLVNFTISF
jgi:membrane-associated phospholipid phosphatase